MSSYKDWKIEPVVLADAPDVARNNVSAFWREKHYRILWGDSVTEEYLIEKQAQSVPDDLIYRRELLRHLKAVDPDTGKLLGYLRLALPVEHATEPDGTPVWPEMQIADVTPEERARIEQAAQEAKVEKIDNGLDDKAQEIQKRILSQGIYIKLRYLAVHPENQRKGVGQALVKAVIDKANELGLDVYLMAYDAGRSVYERLGFREIERHIEDLANYGSEGEHGVYYMLYDTKKKEDASE